MIEIRTAAPDAYANQPDTEELAPGIYRDATTMELFVTDGRQTICLEIAPE